MRSGKLYKKRPKEERSRPGVRRLNWWPPNVKSQTEKEQFKRGNNLSVDDRPKNSKSASRKR